MCTTKTDSNANKFEKVLNKNTQQVAVNVNPMNPTAEKVINI
jgi:hypothetical protein